MAKLEHLLQHQLHHDSRPHTHLMSAYKNKFSILVSNSQTFPINSNNFSEGLVVFFIPWYMPVYIVLLFFDVFSSQVFDLEERELWMIAYPKPTSACET